MNKNTISDELFQKFLRADKINTENLNTIISDNKDTVFGREHGFADIGDIDEYRRRVPLSGYEDYAESVRRMRQGEKNVLSAYENESFCHTSGSTGEPKYIPLSRKALDRYSDYVESYKNRFVRENGGRRLLLTSFRIDPDVPLEGDYILSEVYYRHLYLSGKLDMSEFIGGKDMLFIGDEPDILYAKLWAALAEPVIPFIEGLFLYELLNFFSYFKEHWKKILKDMRERKVPDDIRLSGKLKAQLEAMQVPEERLREIESRCSLGFGRIAKDIWHTGLICGIANKSAISEMAALKMYTEGIGIYYNGYCSSECLIGTPIGVDSCRYALLPDNAFYEFLPEGDSGRETVMPCDVVVGGVYELVVTNFSGFYRYRMGDMVRIVGMSGKCPVMEFEQRKGQALNIAGEKYEAAQLEQAVFGMRELGISTENYFIGESLLAIPGKYIVLMTYDTDAEKIPDEQEAAREFDRLLAQYNSDYADLRGLEQIDAPRLFLCTCDEYEAFMRTGGFVPESAHKKPRHFANREVSETEWKAILYRVRKER